MKLLSARNLREDILSKLKNENFTNKLILISKNPSDEAIYYKNMIIKRCMEFGIEYIDKCFADESHEEILDFINSFDKEDGFIILAPFGDGENLDYLKEEIKLRDLDGFTYESLGKTMEGDFKSLPATVRAIVRFLAYENVEFKGKNIVIANRTSVIGKPLAMYLTSESASVSIINSSTRNSKEYIKNADIFISAVGRAKHYDKSYFSEECIIVDVGTSVINGKIVGDVDTESIKDLDLSYLGSKNGIGSITTITLVEGLKY